jgi:hypothetical protein
MSERTPQALVALGLATRLLFLVGHPRFLWDGAWQVIMGTTLARGEGFVVPWTGAPTHHYPPLYPMLVSLTILMHVSPYLAELASASLLVVVAWWGGRLIFRSKTVAWWCAALAACYPPLFFAESLGFADTLASAAYGLVVMLSILSLENPRLAPLAGVAAGLAYLSKASLGPLLALAILSGLAWRIRVLGWRRVFLDRYHWLAAMALIVTAGWWVVRNVRDFGASRWSGWDTQPYATQVAILASSHPATYLGALGGVIIDAILMIFPLLVMLALMRMGRSSPTRDGSAKNAPGVTSGLLLSLALPILLSVPFVAGFNLAEGHLFADNARYVSVALLPALWLVVPHLVSSEEDSSLIQRPLIWRLAMGALGLVLPLGIVVAMPLSAWAAPLVASSLPTLYTRSLPALRQASLVMVASMLLFSTSTVAWESLGNVTSGDGVGAPELYADAHIENVTISNCGLMDYSASLTGAPAIMNPGLGLLLPWREASTIRSLAPCEKGPDRPIAPMAFATIRPSTWGRVNVTWDRLMVGGTRS